MAEKIGHEIIKEDDDHELLIDNNIINRKKEKRFGSKIIKNKNSSKIIGLNINPNFTICKLDNFKLDNSNQYNKSKRTVANFEKVRNKYIYVHKKKYNNEIEIDEELEENIQISPQNNYFYIPEQSFCNINKKSSKDNNNNTIKFIFVSIILMIICIILIFITLHLVKKVLNKFDEFILKAWLIPIFILITIVNFLFYFLKMFIGSILLFRFYHLRKKRCILRCLFWLFVDNSMIQVYKIRNLITKYKKEFDYL